MGISRTPPTTGTPPLPTKIAGSTKTILIELYKNMHGISRDVPNDNPGLIDAVKLDAATAKSGRALFTSRDYSHAELKKSAEFIAVCISMAANRAKELGYQDQHQTFKTKINRLDETREKLKQEYASLVSEQHQTVRELLAQNKSPKEIAPVLAAYHGRRMQLMNAVTEYAKEKDSTQVNLRSLYLRAAALIPDKDKGKLPTLPAAPTPGV